jgi:hypothetical protein
MNYEITVDRGIDPNTGAPTSLGGQTLTDTVPFAIMIDTSGKITDCSLADAATQVDLVQQVSCSYLGNLFVWDKTQQACVLMFTLQQYAGDPYHSPACPAGSVPVSFSISNTSASGNYSNTSSGVDPANACKISNVDNSYVGDTASNTYSNGTTTVTKSTSTPPYQVQYNSATGACDCFPADNYNPTGAEQCTIQCGTPKVF